MKNSLIHIGDKAYKECDVVMLPTKERTNILKNIDKALLYVPTIESINNSRCEWQHLYILSDEEIKEGDIIKTPTSIARVKTINYEDGNKLRSLITEDIIIISLRYGQKEGVLETTNYRAIDCKKIIATTDKSLKIKSEVNGVIKMITLEEELPRPSNEFLQAYVKAQGKIDKMLVEYETTLVIHPKKPEGDRWVASFGEAMAILYERLKVAPDNTITIKPTEEKTYSREEVINLVRLAMQSKGHTPEYEIQNFITQYF